MATTRFVYNNITGEWQYIIETGSGKTSGALKIVPDIATRDKVPSRDRDGFMFWVIDATGDPSVVTGGALYAWDKPNLVWLKISEQSPNIDIAMDWSQITSRPTSPVSHIDEAVEKRHAHDNKSVLDGIEGKHIHSHNNLSTLAQITEVSGYFHKHENKTALDKFNTKTVDVLITITQENVDEFHTHKNKIAIDRFGLTNDLEITLDGELLPLYTQWATVNKGGLMSFTDKRNLDALVNVEVKPALPEVANHTDLLMFKQLPGDFSNGVDCMLLIQPSQTSFELRDMAGGVVTTTPVTNEGILIDTNGDMLLGGNNTARRAIIAPGSALDAITTDDKPWCVDVLVNVKTLQWATSTHFNILLSTWVIGVDSNGYYIGNTSLDAHVGSPTGKDQLLTLEHFYSDAQSKYLTAIYLNGKFVKTLDLTYGTPSGMIIGQSVPLTETFDIRVKGIRIRKSSPYNGTSFYPHPFPWLVNRSGSWQPEAMQIVADKLMELSRINVDAQLRITVDGNLLPLYNQWATQTIGGLMSAADKTTLDTLANSTVTEFPEVADDGDVMVFHKSVGNLANGVDCVLSLQPVLTGNVLEDIAKGVSTPTTIVNSGILIDDNGVLQIPYQHNLASGYRATISTGSIIDTTMVDGSAWCFDMLFELSSIGPAFTGGASLVVVQSAEGSNGFHVEVDKTQIKVGPKTTPVSIVETLVLNKKYLLTYEVFKDPVDNTFKYAVYLNGSLKGSGPFLGIVQRGLVLGNTTSSATVGTATVGVRGVRIRKSSPYKGKKFYPHVFPWLPTRNGSWERTSMQEVADRVEEIYPSGSGGMTDEERARLLPATANQDDTLFWVATPTPGWQSKPIPGATQTSNGLMSKTDKANLDRLVETGGGSGFPEIATDYDIMMYQPESSTGNGADCRFLLQPSTSNHEIVDSAAGTSTPVVITNNGATVNAAGDVVVPLRSNLVIPANSLPTDVFVGSHPWCMDIVVRFTESEGGGGGPIPYLFACHTNNWSPTIMWLEGGLYIQEYSSDEPALLITPFILHTWMRITIENFQNPETTKWCTAVYFNGALVGILSKPYPYDDRRTLPYTLFAGYDRFVGGELRALRIRNTAPYMGESFDPDAEPLPWTDVVLPAAWKKTQLTVNNIPVSKGGNIDLSKSDLGLGNVNNTSDADKPISTATQAALDAKASTAPATQTADGLMSAADKKRLDELEPGGLPVGKCTNIRCIALSTTVRIKWVDPTDLILDGLTLSEWDYTVLRRKLGSAPANINDGELIISSSVRNEYSAVAYTDTLPTEETYYYRLFPVAKNKKINEDTANIFESGANTWASVADVVRSGDAEEYFAVGDIMTVDHNEYGQIEMQVAAFDAETLVDETKQHSMTLLAKKVIVDLQFDAPEKAYGITADTVFDSSKLLALTGFSTANGNYFLVDEDATGNDRKWQRKTGAMQIRHDGTKWVVFNLTSPAVVASQTAASADPWSGEWSDSAVIEKSKKYYAFNGASYEEATVTDGAVVTADTYYEANPDTDRINYGYNRWEHSGLRQWLNASGAVGTWWAAQNIWDDAPNYANTLNGFLNGITELDFLGAIGEVKNTSRSNGATDGGFVVETIDKVFLASATQLYGSATDGVYEGQILDLFVTATNADRIKYNNANSAQHWWLRSPSTGTGNVRYVTSSGTLQSTIAYGTRGVVPACVIC